jgi:hypothetical protein
MMRRSTVPRAAGGEKTARTDILIAAFLNGRLMRFWAKLFLRPCVARLQVRRSNLITACARLEAHEPAPAKGATEGMPRAGNVNKRGDTPRHGEDHD